MTDFQSFQEILSSFSEVFVLLYFSLLNEKTHRLLWMPDSVELKDSVFSCFFCVKNFANFLIFFSFCTITVSTLNLIKGRFCQLLRSTILLLQSN